MRRESERGDEGRPGGDAVMTAGLPACLTALKFTSPITAMMMMAASTACGRWYSSGVRNSSATSTISAVITELMPVLAPAFMLTAVRENEPETGKAWVKLPTTLARPWPTSSWLGSIRCGFWPQRPWRWRSPP